jgi:hypothetical protein
MAKPIFVVELPNHENHSVVDASNYITSRLPDYNVLVMRSGVDKIKHTVYYEKDFEKVDLDELREIVKEKMI